MPKSRTLWNRFELGTPIVFGCIDPAATNYNPNANTSDGSCVYLPPSVPGCMNPVASNYNPAATIDDGSCVFGSSNVVFDTAGQKLVATKVGANIFELDTNKLPSWTSLATSLSLHTYYYTISSPLMDDSKASIVNTFLSAVGATVGVYYPIQVFIFPSLIDWLVSTFSPVFVQLDQESQGGTSMSNAAYISRSQQVISHVSPTPCSWDTALIYKNNSVSLARNAALASQTETVLGRQYEQISPDICVFTSDQDYNYLLLANYFDVLLPQYLTLFLSRLPNLTKEVILQWHNEDTGLSFIRGKPLGNWAIGEMARYTLSNTEYYPYLFWMTLGNLISGGTPTASAEYNYVKLVVPCFKFLNTMSVAIPYDKCKAQGFSNGINSFCILITNASASTNIILAADITIPTKTVSGNFTRNSIWATSWDAATQTDTAVSEASITVRPYSVSVVTFTTV